jgi:Anthrone oxygenase
VTFAVLATACAGLFSGAALYINLVEHPARVSCGPELAIREFAPSYKRATVLQVSLALAGSVTGLAAALAHSDLRLALASLLLVFVVPFTLIVILPVNKRLMHPSLDSSSADAMALLARWGKLHAVRTALSLLAFLLFLSWLAQR